MDSGSNLQKPLCVSYGQISVFGTGVEKPFNFWTERHVSQSFAWRPEAVGFKIPFETGKADVVVQVADRPQGVSGAGIIAVEVPFNVRHSEPIVVASISDEFSFDLQPGLYQLLYEGDAAELKLTFWTATAPRFFVLRNDGRIPEPEELLLHAEPA